MKRINFFVVICCVIALCSCGGNSVTGANGKSYDNYIDACADEDFDAAYKLLEKEGYKAENSEHFYVFEKETSFLAGMNEEQSTKRLLYLIKEEETALDREYDQLEKLQKHLSKLMSLGVAADNIELVRGIYKQCSGQIHLNPDLSVIEMMAKQGTDEDNQLVIMHDKARYDKKWLKSNDALNHVDVAIRVQNKDLAKGLIEFLNAEDKAVAEKKLKAAFK